jgi:transposase-like protein
MFKRRRFLVEIIVLGVRWYCRYGISYAPEAGLCLT